MPTAKPRITLGLPNHPRCRALIDGKIGVEGYELDISRDFVSAGERHYRFLHDEWDVGECSAASLLRAIEKSRPFCAIPVFFERGPRQRNIYHCAGKLTHPKELKGKKFGCFRYGATAVVWARGFLLDTYGLKTADMQWYVSGREVYIPHELAVKVERLDPPPPFGQEKEQLAKLLSEGLLHGAIVPGDSGYLGLFGGGSVPPLMGQYSGVKPLFDNTDEIIRQTKESGIYPIIHVLALRREVVEEYPDFPGKLTKAFRDAKARAAEYMTPAELDGYKKEAEVLGEDPYAYVLGETEKRTMRALNRYQIEQGLMREELPLEKIFARLV
jgi:4,5-dihydroxyphthalate decarboxylase